jgi:hypothetical protein
MNPEVTAMSAALDMLRAKLIATPRTTAGFGEMRALYMALTNALIIAGDKADAELAAEIEKVTKDVSEEWASNKDQFGPWLTVLQPIVSTVGALLSASKLGNPLALLLL